MSYERIKQVAKSAGVYRQARWVHRHIMQRGELRHFREECELYRQFVSRGDLCFDIGANYGAKTEVLLTLGAQVVAFEPQPDCFMELQARNPAATAIRCALGDNIGTAQMRVDKFRTGSSLRTDWRDDIEGEISVPVTTLARAIAEYGVPRFCKIDVEGFESKVLSTLRTRIQCLSFEFSAHRIEDAMQCFDILARVGSISANFTSRDEPKFVLPEWVDERGARAFLSSPTTKSERFAWGDAFVRIGER